MSRTEAIAVLATRALVNMEDQTIITEVGLQSGGEWEQTISTHSLCLKNPAVLNALKDLGWVHVSEVQEV